MNILVTNDDGIYAKGINEVVEILMKKGHNVFVVAPDRERSASGQAITLHSPIRVNEVNLWEGVIAYSIDGTPTDCSKIALTELIKEPIDIVISGINRGPNLGTDVMYSGTVSAAIEAVIIGVPAIAISLADYSEPNYTYAAKIAEKLALHLKKRGVPNDTLLNVNVPNVSEDEIKGVAITALGERRYKKAFHRRVDPRGKVYYWVAGEVEDYYHDENADVVKIKENYVTVSPIHFDFTKYNLINMLKEWNLEK